MKRLAALALTALFAYSFPPIAIAQVVDPCQYGCPKDGCPKCGGGGPLDSASGQSAKAQSGPFVKTQSTPRDECVTGCKNDNRDRVKECSIYYPPDSDPVKHRECLDRAKTKFDACMASC